MQPSNFSMLQGSQGSRGCSRSLIRSDFDVVNVVIAKNFNHLDEYIQLQALEVRHPVAFIYEHNPLTGSS